MTDRKKAELLGEALNNLMQSAQNYIEDGTWLNDMLYDIQHAQNLIKRIQEIK
jgi:hypothetical protein